MAYIVASTPNPAVQTLVYAALRATVTVLGAFGVGVGPFTNDATTVTVAGGIAVLIGIG